MVTKKERESAAKKANALLKFVSKTGPACPRRKSVKPKAGGRKPMTRAAMKRLGVVPG